MDVRGRKEEILRDFYALDANDSVECDHFFERWGVGQTLDVIDAPYERLESYRYLLEEIKKANPEKYKLAHKGTAFFFCGLSLFDLKYFESAVFYMTAALSEDQRRSGNASLADYVVTPAGQFLSLNPSAKWVRFTSVFRDAIQEVIDEFNADNSASITIEEFVRRFVHPMIEQGHYSIITSLYSYILDYKEKRRNLNLAGEGVDSMEPILVNLFKGALIFETLLKYYYPMNNRGQRILTLGGFSSSSDFVSDFPDVNLSVVTNTLQEILDGVTDKGLKNTMEITARIRNTTGHKLIWDNIFSEAENYTKLFKQEIFAILYVITKQW